LGYEKEFSLAELNKPEDWKNLTNMAKKHVPVIEVPSSAKAKEVFTVKIKVGGIDGVEHPNTLGHWVNWLDLFAGERLISRIVFAPEVSNGYTATLDIALNETAKLRAQAYCNLHGVWEGKAKKVTVE